MIIFSIKDEYDKERHQTLLAVYNVLQKKGYNLIR